MQLRAAAAPARARARTCAHAHTHHTCTTSHHTSPFATTTATLPLPLPLPTVVCGLHFDAVQGHPPQRPPQVGELQAQEVVGGAGGGPEADAACGAGAARGWQRHDAAVGGPASSTAGRRVAGLRLHLACAPQNLLPGRLGRLPLGGATLPPPRLHDASGCRAGVPALPPALPPVHLE